MLKVSEDHAKEAQVRLSGQTCTTKLPTYAAHPREGVYRRGGSVHIQNAPLLPIQGLHILGLRGGGMRVGLDLVDRDCRAAPRRGSACLV